MDIQRGEKGCPNPSRYPNATFFTLNL